MRQFLENDENKFHDLEMRARITCVVFREQDLPPGCVPPKIRIGFEIAPSGVSTIYIDKGVLYVGSNREFREWVTAGLKRFPDFKALRDWVIGPLAQAFKETLPELDEDTFGPSKQGHYYQFRFVRNELSWRACFKSEPTSSAHVLHDGGGPYICWDRTLFTKKAARQVAKLWVETYG
jgi:hypothetical protein